MKITATRKEDILRQKAEYEERESAREARYREEERKYDEAESAVLDPIRKTVEDMLAPYNLLDFDIRVERRWREGIEVIIQCNEHRVHDPSIALAWDYKAYLDSDHNLKTESGSWSGLQATTREHLDSLKQTLDALEMLVGTDWKAMLDKQLPNWKDYFTTENSTREPRPDFEGQLKEAELADIVGKDIVIKVKPISSDGAFYRGQEWIQIVRETPKQYEVRQWPVYRYAKEIDIEEQKKQMRSDIDNNGVTVRIAKRNIDPVTPVETMEV